MASNGETNSSCIKGQSEPQQGRGCRSRENSLHRVSNISANGSDVCTSLELGEAVLFYIASVKSCKTLEKVAELATPKTSSPSEGKPGQVSCSNVSQDAGMASRAAGLDKDNSESGHRRSRWRQNKVQQRRPEDFDFIQGVPHCDFNTLSTFGVKQPERILVLGIGGGCDVFAAYALSKHIGQLHRKATVLYGNTKTFGKRQKPAALRLVQKMEYLWSVPKDVVPIVAEGKGFCALELGCPRGPEGSPLIFVLPAHSKDLEERTAENVDAVVSALQSLHVDLVVGVDCGGDSISGGVDWQGSPEAGRDMQMLHCLKVSGIPLLHVVLGPGSDGETEESVMRACCAKLSAEGSLRGAFSVEPLLADMVGCCTALAPTRTPNLMKQAQSGELRSVQPPNNKSGDYVCITRGRRNTKVPRDWLTKGLVIDYGNTNVCVQSCAGRRER